MINAKTLFKTTAPKNKRAIRAEIKRLHDRYPGLMAQEILNRIHESKRLSGMPKPELRTVQDIIHKWDNPKTPQEKEAREKYREANSSWHLGILDKYPLPAESIPYVFAVQAYIDKINQVRGEWQGPLEPVSVRQAKWVARLWPFCKGSMTEDDIVMLWRLSHFYTYHEVMSALADETLFDTSEFDRKLRQHEDLAPIVEEETLSWLEKGRDNTLSYRAIKELGRKDIKVDTSTFIKVMKEAGLWEAYEAGLKRWERSLTTEEFLDWWQQKNEVTLTAKQRELLEGKHRALLSSDEAFIQFGREHYAELMELPAKRKVENERKHSQAQE
jgi:hypothetical protein